MFVHVILEAGISYFLTYTNTNTLDHVIVNLAQCTLISAHWHFGFAFLYINTIAAKICAKMIYTSLFLVTMTFFTCWSQWKQESCAIANTTVRCTLYK